MNNINELVIQSKSKHYCEPFGGSLSVYLNISKEFDSYTINEYDRNLVNLYNTFKDINFEFYKKEINYIFDTFGNPKEKDSYYELRKYYNDNLWMTDSNKEGIYLYCLINTCINGLCRFGPNGFNQSWGHRNTLNLTENIFKEIQKKLNSANIENMDFLDMDIKNDTLYFLDPPYTKLPSSYSKKEHDNNWKNKFLNKIKNIKEYVYTDVYEPYIEDFLKCEVIYLRNINNTSPLCKGKRKSDNKEVIYTNIQRNKLF